MIKKRKRGSWDDLFIDIDEEFEEMRKRMDLILERMTEGNLSLESSPMIYGFSMRVGPDGKPKLQEFGNTTTPTDFQESRREPLTDVIEEPDKIRIVMELPGVDKEDIQLDATESSLDIKVDNPQRRFSKHLDLPCHVDQESAKANYKNGVLEICLARMERGNTAKSIEIE